MKKTRASKKAVFFTVDALIASIIILSGLIAVYSIYASKSRPDNIMSVSSSLMQSLSNIDAGQLNLPYINTLILSGTLKSSSLNDSALEVIGELWAMGRINEAREIARELVEGSFADELSGMGAAIYVNNQEIYSRNSSLGSAEDSSYLSSSFRLVSGINESMSKEGFSSRAILSAINSKIQPSYAYFGGLVGQGNITQFIMLPNYTNYTQIKEAYLEFSTDSNFSSSGNNFSLSINGNSIGNLSCSGGGFMRSTNCSIDNSSFSYFQPGINLLKISFQNLSTAYVSGGFFRVKTETSDVNYIDVYYNPALNSASKKEYLPGVDSVINIYSSFYAPGNITSIELFLNYTTDLPLFVKVGGVLVYNSSQNGSVSVLLNNSNISSSFNYSNYSYSAISDKTIPIKIGHDAIEQMSSIIGGNADVILITDISGSMAWQVGDYTANNTYNWTSADLETGIEQFNTRNIILLSDGFEEGATLSNWTKTSSGYASTTTQKNDGTFSQRLSSNLASKFIWSKNGILNTSSCSRIYVSFWSRDDDLDANDIQLYYNASNNVWVSIADLNEVSAAEDTWTLKSYSTTAANYLHAGFSIRFGGTTGSNENHWIDDVTVICEKTNYTLVAEYNSTPTIYTAGGSNYQVVTAVKSIITIDSYNPIASSITYANNKRPDLQIAFYNGAGYGAYSSCSVNASMGNDALNTNDWNCTIAADSSVFSAWATASNRRIQVRAINLDAYNNTIYDEINVSAVYLNVSGYTVTFTSADNNNGNNTRACNDSAIYQNDTSRISLAKCLDKQFIDIIMNDSYSGNRMWLVDFSNNANNYTSNSKTALKAEVDTYSPSQYTCICCAINMAYNLLNSNSNSSRNKYVMVMSDGIANYCCSPSGCIINGTSTNGVSGCSGTGQCTGNECDGPINSAINASYRVHTTQNATVYSVGFGPVATCVNANYTLNQIASKGNGSYYSSQDPEELLEIYRQIATSIVNQSLVYRYQTVLSVAGVNSTLYPNSYLRINYTPSLSNPPFVFGKIPITLESQPFGNNETSGILEIPAGVSVSDAKVTSYSGVYWTHNLTVDSARVFNLSVFGDNYSSLGDPFLVSIPVSLLLPGNHSIRISTGTSPANDVGGSKDDRVIYTLLMSNSVSYSSVASSKDGCSWLLNFSDGTNTIIKIPPAYNGTQSCTFSNASYNQSDSVSSAAYNMLRQLDLNSDGILEINIDEQSLSVDSVVIGKVPSMWGPAKIEARMWK